MAVTKTAGYGPAIRENIWFRPPLKGLEMVHLPIKNRCICVFQNYELLRLHPAELAEDHQS